MEKRKIVLIVALYVILVLWLAACVACTGLKPPTVESLCPTVEERIRCESRIFPY